MQLADSNPTANLQKRNPGRATPPPSGRRLARRSFLGRLVTSAAVIALVFPAFAQSALIGDPNADKTVNNSDVKLTRGQSGMPVTSANFREDITVDGTIGNADVRTVRSAFGHSLP
jgi:hypothetical protein